MKHYKACSDSWYTDCHCILFRCAQPCPSHVVLYSLVFISFVCLWRFVWFYSLGLRLARHVLFFARGQPHIAI